MFSLSQPLTFSMHSSFLSLTLIFVPINSVLPPSPLHCGGKWLIGAGDWLVLEVPAGLAAYPTVVAGDSPLLVYPLFGNIVIAVLHCLCSSHW
jgi:hypothetical protein